MRLAVVGGGISGLAAAWFALQELPDLQVRLYEASSRVGGVIRSEWRGGALMEGGPDSLLADKPAALDLCRQIGLDQEILPTSERYRQVLVAHGRKLYPLPEGFRLVGPTRITPFVLTPLLSPLGKLRAGLDLLLPPRPHPEDETLASYITRRLGREVLERLAAPLVAGIYASDPERLSLRATMPRILDLERKYGGVVKGLLAQAALARKQKDTGPRYSLFYSLRQGLEAMVARLAERLPSGTILTGRAVQALRPPGEGQPWRLSGSGWEERADAVILALPVKDAARVADTFDPALAAELSGIRVASSATLNLLYDERQVRRLKAFGVVVPDIEQRSFFACTFSSLKYEGRAPAGSVLLRAFVGGMLRPEMAALPEDEVVARVRQDLGELLGVRGEPRTWWLCRHPDSMPQYEVGHLQRVERIEALEARHPGLALAGSAYRGVSVPDCVQSGRRAARQMAAYLSRLSPSESA